MADALVLPPGLPVDTIVVAIDYDIIRHFSEHLYSSPNKAVEELVANSFDAFATSSYVYVPGSLVEGRVLVWDDGTSMDADDLHKLWWIARSPKSTVSPDRVVTKDGDRRALIGKFGIGKLASYAVGHRIAHLCRRGERFLYVGVDYRDVPHLDEHGDLEDGGYKTPIRQMTESEARAYVKSLFRDGVQPAALESLWDVAHWTLAIIDDLKEGVRLTEGRLVWVLGNGMPLRPDFKVWVNDRPIEPKLGRGATPWDLSEPKLQEALAGAWSDAVSAGDVRGKYRLLGPSADTDGLPAVELPALGTVWVEVRLFDGSLLNVDEDAPRSHGFFVMVRGRLLNPDDDRLLLPDPSFGAFYRCQFVVHANGLDEDLLADRERLQPDTPRTKELGVLQRALYRPARAELERRDEQEDQRQRSESLLPVDSAEHFREPMSGLLLRHGGEQVKPFDLAKAHIERAPLSGDAPLAILGDSNTLRVNLDHPLYDQIRKQLGGSRAARDALQVLDVIAVSERLFEGYLYGLGLESSQIDRILSWRDGLYRSIATRFGNKSFEEVIREVKEASYVGGRPFEKSLIKLFGLMGFEAKHDGASGQKDGLVVAPIGREEYRFTVEAKGSSGSVGNDDADVGGAIAHRNAAGASLAIIVARKFAGFERAGSERAAILQECDAAKGVSIVTIDTLDDLYRAVRDYGYPLNHLFPILSKIEPPVDKINRVMSLSRPTEGFNFRGVLDAIWSKQQGEAAGDLVPYRSVWQARPDRWGVRDFEDFERRLLGLVALSEELIRLVTDRELVSLLQSPVIIAERIQAAVQARLPREQSDAVDETEVHRM